MMNKPMTIAFYLPQFHEVRENNEWWGDGFTEWTNVRMAKSLFRNHQQPRIPLDENYYNLLDANTVKWQTELAEKYNIDGFAYYHYWFEGRKILEKPAERLIKMPDISQKFFFFWANHTWYKADKGKKTVLLEQTYGGREDWKEHYNYLSSFFKDERYIKICNKPVFGIYVPLDIPQYHEMMKFFIEQAKVDGFDGIYFIESCNSIYMQDNIIAQSKADSILYRQPNYAFEIIRNGERKMKLSRYIRKFCRHFSLPYIEKISYADVARIESDIDNFVQDGGTVKDSFCISCGWDNTPRHGKYGQVVVGLDKPQFKKTFATIYEQSMKREADFIFINAWNEWAEGMMLEPDVQGKYQLLESISEVIDDISDC